jgi:non-ribosomal peptide synthetase component F
MTLLAAYSAVLHRYSGDPETVIGAALAGRTRPEIEPLIGFFINTMAVRADLRGEPTFLDLLERIKRVTLDSNVHQDAPFEDLVQTLHPDRTTSQIPLFRTMFVLPNTDSTAVSSASSFEMDCAGRSRSSVTACATRAACVSNQNRVRDRSRALASRARVASLESRHLPVSRRAARVSACST